MNTAAPAHQPVDSRRDNGRNADSGMRGSASWLATAFAPSALLALFVGLVVTAFAWQAERQNAVRLTDARFEYRSARIADKLEDLFRSDEIMLRGMVALFSANAPPERAQWRRYLDGMVADDDPRGRQAVAFAPRTLDPEREAHKSGASSEGAGIAHSPSPNDRAESFSIAYLRAFGGATRLKMGVDLGEDRAAAEAMARARDSGKAVMSAPISIASSTAPDDHALVLIVPVYAHAAVPQTPAERQTALQGFAIVVYALAETVRHALGPDAGLIGVSVVDGSRAIFASPEIKHFVDAGFRPTVAGKRTIAAASGTWTLEFTALPPFFGAAGDNGPLLVLVAGVLVSALLCGLVGRIADTRRQALAIAGERTRELRAALAKAEDNESRVRAVVDNATDGIVTISEHGAIESFNPAAERIFGYFQAEVLGKNVSILMPAPDHERHDTYIESYLRTGNAKIIGIGREVLGRHRNGSTIPLELGISEITIDERRCFCGILRDITERKAADRALEQERELLETRVAERTQILTRTNEALQQEINERKRIEGELRSARELALQAADAKAGFLANMSHEIRTPMNAVIGTAALLQDTPLNAEQRSYIETICASGDVLLATINDILDFSKLESGTLELEVRPIEVGQIVEEAFDMLAPKASAKGIDLNYLIGDDVPAWVLSDATRLRQILVNLLANAVKFTDVGEVCVTVSRYDKPSSAPMLQIAVRDTGIGVPASKMSALFKPFSQADASMTRRFGGTGLGLAICARHVQTLRGEIWAESEEGRGSTFHFTVPAPPIEAGTARHYPREPQPDLFGQRMLLVAEHPTGLHILETQCRRWGLDVTSAGTGADALTAIGNENPFQVVLVDANLPDIDANDLAQAIRNHRNGRDTALIRLTPGAARSGGAPADGLFSVALAKPVKHSKLLRAILASLGIEGPEQPTREPAYRADATLGQRVPLRILVAEDSKINQKLAARILAKLGYECEIAENGVEVLDRLAAKHFDVIFMDLQMPVMGGLEATRRIVDEWPAPIRPYIIAMTAIALPGDRERCLAAGMDDYIAKPVLPGTVQRAIERLASTRSAPDGGGAPMAAVDARTLVELRALDEPGKPSLLKGLIGDYLTEAPRYIDDIRQCVAARDAMTLVARAHKFAGISVSLGASEVAEVCVRIEKRASNGELSGLEACIDELVACYAKTRVTLANIV